ncbi:MAG: PIN domain-containing protein [Candidatus Nezhaarchaeota archaeon]|nr:PIN domain-containing protein [Candidatus Nezhaarchaeota archaeon]
MEYPEGVVDVGIVVVSLFDNPLKPRAIEFMADVLKQRRRAAIPISAVIGAYHVATRYLRLPRIDVKRVLAEMLLTRSPALYPHIPLDVAMYALDLATYYGVEPWDGYVIELAKRLGNSIVYTLDEELSKIEGVIVVNPFPEELVEQYHEYVGCLMSRGGQ